MIKRFKQIYKQISPLFIAVERRKLALVVAANTFLSLLDLIGVSLVGLIGALSVRGIQSSVPGSRLSQILEILGLGDNSLQFAVTVIGSFAATTFLVRTFLSALVTRWLLTFLGYKSADISSKVAERVIGTNIQKVERAPENETLFSISTGATSLTIGVVGSAVTLLSDLILVLLLFILLVIFTPSVAIPTIAIFIVTVLFLNRAMHKRSSKLGSEWYGTSTRSNTTIIDSLSIQRNIFTSNLQNEFVNKIYQARLSVGRILAKSEFMPYITKYVIELVLVLFTFSLAASQFILQDATQAVATLSVFMAAGMRVAPAVMRIQQASIQFVGSLASSKSTLEILDYLTLDYSKRPQSVLTVEKKDEHVVVCKDLDFKFSSDSHFSLKGINLSLYPGTFTAIVGQSGSGKSTLVDLMLGVLGPNSGEVKLCGLPPIDAIRMEPNLVGYVPQHTHIIAGTVFENVALSASNSVTSEMFWQVIKSIGMEDFISSLPHGLETKLGQGGHRLSGGQAQRIGIARALIKSPRLIILDEATSALDAQIEYQISKNISDLKNSGATVVVIAHRLSTVREADTVVYMSEGQIVSVGSFEEIRTNVPDFDIQAKLMGL
jgi:ABC-type multidrug transport system fused ATPase/permease subunit